MNSFLDLGSIKELRPNVIIIVHHFISNLLGRSKSYGVFYSITAFPNLVLDALLAQALLILSLELGVNLSALGGSVAVELGLICISIWYHIVLYMDTYRLGGVLLAELGLLVGLVVVVVRGVGLVGLGSQLVGDGAAILGVKVLVAVGLALGVAGTILELGDRGVALVASLVDGTVSDARLA